MKAKSLGRWIASDRGATLLVTPWSDQTHAQIVDELQHIERTSAAKKVPDSDIQDYLAALADRLHSNHLLTHKPEQASGLHDHKDHHRYDGIMAEIQQLDEPTLAKLPIRAITDLRKLHSRDPRSARLLADELTKPDKAHLLRQLLDTEPEWLRVAPGEAWTIIGDFAADHMQTELAANSYNRSQERSGDDHLHTVRIREAISRPDTDAAHILGTTDSNDSGPMIAIARLHLVDHNYEATLHAINELPLDDLPRNAKTLAAMFEWQAQMNLRRPAAAAAAAQRLVEAEPEFINAHRLLYIALGSQADAFPHGSETQRSLYSLALDIARHCLTAGTAWSMPDPEIREQAATFATLLDQPEQVLELCGDRQDYRFRLLRLRVHVAAENFEAARNETRLCDTNYLSHVHLGLTALNNGDEQAIAKQHFSNAFAESSDDLERHTALILAGNHGATLDELNFEDSEASELNLAMFSAMEAIQNQQYVEAANMVRPHITRSITAVSVLAEALFARDLLHDAVDELMKGAHHFGSARLASDAFDFLWFEGEHERAETVVEEALTINDSSGDRLLLRQRHVKIALERSDHATATTRGQAALAEFPNDHGTFWFLVSALHHRGHTQRAHELLTSNQSIHPDTPERAQLAIAVRHLTEPGEDTIAYALDQTDRFPQSKIVAGCALLTITLAGNPPVEPDLAQRGGAIYNQWSEELGYLSATVDPEDPDVQGALREIVQQIPQGQPDNDRDKARAELVTGIVRGELPVGFVCTAIERSTPQILATLVNSRAPLVSIALHPLVHDVEVALATEHLNGPVAVDLSVLMTTQHIDWKPDTVAGLTTTYVADDLLVDLRKAKDDYERSATGAQLLIVDGEPQLVDTSEVQAKTKKTLETALDLVTRLGTTVNTRGPGRADKFTPTGEATDELPDIPEDAMRWLEPLVAADIRSVPLLSDEAALRNLARALGVPTFGSFALLEARLRASDISVEQFNELADQFALAGHHDLPFNPQQLLRLVRSGDAGRDAVQRIYARPRTWLEHHIEASRILVAITRSAAHHPHQAANEVHRWCHAAATGIASSVPPPLATPLLGSIIAVLLGEPSALTAHGDTIIDAIDIGAQAHNSDDINGALQYAVTTMLEIADSNPHHLHPNSVELAFTGLSESRQQIVRTTILNHGT